MLKTAMCDLLGIEVPIILAPMGSATSAEFAAAVSNQRGLGVSEIMCQLIAEAEEALSRRSAPARSI